MKFTAYSSIICINYIISKSRQYCINKNIKLIIFCLWKKKTLAARDLHVDKLIAQASSRLYILRVCKFYGYSQDQLNKLFDSLILSLFAYGLEVWGSAGKKYLDRIDNFCKRAHRYGYTAKADFEISSLIEETNFCSIRSLRRKIILLIQDLLPPKRSRILRKRGHEFQLPQIRPERYKNSFMNRFLFKFV